MGAGVPFGGSVGPWPTDISLADLGGGYYVKLTDALFVVTGILLALFWKFKYAWIVGLVLILLGILGVVIGWD